MNVPELSENQVLNITRKITLADKQASSYFEVPFQMPIGMTRLDVNFSYPKSDTCVLDLGVLDSTATAYPTRNGFRGWSGGARSSFFLSTKDATPGYYSGLLPEGVWTLLLGLYTVPPEGVEVELSFSTDASPRETVVEATDVPVRRDQAGWFRGDLHCHTHHSDAKGAPETLAKNARRNGLDFLAVTDHNTTSQWKYFGPSSTPDLIFVPGMEITTARGHANIFGLSE